MTTIKKDLKFGKRISLEAKVGMQSLVGVVKCFYPIQFGNYFDFPPATKDTPIDDAIRCVNMWAENLREASRLYLTDGLIEGVLFEEINPKYGNIQWFVVDDPRLPSKDWLHNEFCWTGGFLPLSNELRQEMYSIHEQDLME